MDKEKVLMGIGGNMNRFSIIQNKKECYVCGQNYGLHIHEIFFGTANRKKSIEYGLCVYLCPKHHNMSNDGVHFNKELDNKIKQIGQLAFEQKYTELDFLKIFGRNYK